MEEVEIVDYEESLDEKESLFNCVYQEIDTVINKVVVYTGVRDNIQTVNGLRTLIAFNLDGKQSAFFTNSKRLKEKALKPDRRYPFRAIIKIVVFGNYLGFDFYPPTTPITQEDIDNFDFYKKTKFKNWKR